MDSTTDNPLQNNPSKQHEEDDISANGASPKKPEPTSNEPSMKIKVEGRANESPAGVRTLSAKKQDDDISNKYRYSVYNEWPSHLTPLSVEGVIEVDGHLTYAVRRVTRKPTPNLDRTNGLLVRAESFRILFPQLVIQFYEQRIAWAEKPEDEDPYEKAKVAEELASLRRNKNCDDKSKNN